MNVVEGAIVYSNLLVLLSVGLTITYITTGVPNFAQGSFAILGSYFTLTLLRFWEIHPYYSIPAAFVFGGIFGILVYLLMLRPLIERGASVVILMISTLALDLILLGVIGAYSGYLAESTHKSATKFIFTQYDFDVGQFSGILFVSVAVISVVFLGMFVLLYKTKFGVALRASMENPSLAEVMGVNVEYTRIFSWFLSGSLASVAGTLLPFRQEIVPLTGALIIVSIFASSIVGGLGSIIGALVGGYVIGFSESYLTYRLSLVFGTHVLVYSKVISLIVLVIMLIIAPTGITGINWRRLIWKRSLSQ